MGESQSITISHDPNRLTEASIERMMKEAEEFAEEDKLMEARSNAQIALKSYLMSVNTTLHDYGKTKGLAEQMEGVEIEQVKEILTDCWEWLDTNPESEVKEIEEKSDEVKEICSPIILKYNEDDTG